MIVFSGIVQGIMTNFAQLREKYLKMAKSVGVDETITALSNEIGTLETRSFDGGFSREKFETIEKLRELSRELWTQRFKL